MLSSKDYILDGNSLTQYIFSNIIKRSTGVIDVSLSELVSDTLKKRLYDGLLEDIDWDRDLSDNISDTVNNIDDVLLLLVALVFSTKRKDNSPISIKDVNHIINGVLELNYWINPFNEDIVAENVGFDKEDISISPMKLSSTIFSYILKLFEMEDLVLIKPIGNDSFSNIEVELEAGSPFELALTQILFSMEYITHGDGEYYIPKDFYDVLKGDDLFLPKPEVIEDIEHEVVIEEDEDDSVTTNTNHSNNEIPIAPITPDQGNDMHDASPEEEELLNLLNERKSSLASFKWFNETTKVMRGIEGDIEKEHIDSFHTNKYYSVAGILNIITSNKWQIIPDAKYEETDENIENNIVKFSTIKKALYDILPEGVTPETKLPVNCLYYDLDNGGMFNYLVMIHIPDIDVELYAIVYTDPVDPNDGFREDERFAIFMGKALESRDNKVTTLRMAVGK